MISVALIEDSRLLRESLEAWLGQLPDVRVVASTGRADSAVLRESAPAVVLLDVSVWNQDRRSVATVRHGCPGSRVIVFGLPPGHEEIVELLVAGASGFILKDGAFADLADTLRAVAAGRNVLPPDVASALFSRMARDAAARERDAMTESVRMSPREHQVISLIGAGLGNKEIAARLGIASHTVKSHVRNVMEKLHLHSRLQIAAYSHRFGSAPPLQ